MLSHALVPLLAALAVAQAPAPLILNSGTWRITAHRDTLTDLRVALPDRRGARDAATLLATDLTVDGFAAGLDFRAQRPPDGLNLLGLVYHQPRGIALGTGPEPAHVPADGRLGQTFDVAADATFTEVAVCIPTWHTTDSAATLRLRREGPDGEVVGERRLENLTDNAWQTLTVPPQTGGRWFVELAEPRGQVGWWTHRRDALPGGEAWTDAEPQPDQDRALRVNASTALPAALHLRVDGRRLTLRASWAAPAGTAAPAPAFLWRTPWTLTGYNVGATSGATFFRYFTDTQRYWPAEQMKRRRTNAGPPLGPARWVEADGNADVDLLFLGADVTLNWSASDDALTHRLTVAESAEHAVELMVVAKPRHDRLPADWPRFFSSDPALDEDLNRFFYERALSWAPGGISPWIEWTALTHGWFAGAARDALVRDVERMVVDEAGYVYTWGGSPGWPFPDNAAYDTRHFDTNARLILAAWRVYAWTRDVAWLRAQAPRLRRAMGYQLDALQGREGLLVSNSDDVDGRHRGVGANYWDILPFGHLDAYGNAVYLASLRAMADIERALAGEPAGGQPPATYDALAERCRAAYDATFWDDRAGRYIGCVDVDGERHDYGFTFVNLEALYYGHGNSERARAVYQWMEDEPTHSGKADTYTRWIFAPRATTIHNPRWGNRAPTPPPGAGEPWWHFGWRGTPWEEQCQDGGAILYTSFYDVMNRFRFHGADDAWARFTAILDRYRLPDRLCGGPPLYLGEIPQQENPGAVGLDVPFPESGLVPTIFLYGVLGVSADAAGLRIAPDLPLALSVAGVENLSWAGETWTLRAERERGGWRVEAVSPTRRHTGRLEADQALLISDPDTAAVVPRSGGPR